MPKRRRQRPNKIKSMSEYWERRYKVGGDSGAGSRGEAAQFKAEYINRFIAMHNDVSSVVDWGCGDGQVCSFLDLSTVHYTGVEVSGIALQQCMERQPKPIYMLWKPSDPIRMFADVAMSIDVLFHFPTDKDYKTYLKVLFGSSRKYVIIHSTDFHRDTLAHVRHRTVRSDIQRLYPSWHLKSMSDGIDPAKFMVYERVKS